MLLSDVGEEYDRGIGLSEQVSLQLLPKSSEIILGFNGLRKLAPFSRNSYCKLHIPICF